MTIAAILLGVRAAGISALARTPNGISRTCAASGHGYAPPHVVITGMSSG